MKERKLDTSTGAGGRVAVARTRFDRHLNECGSCPHNMCNTAQQLWRSVCVTAMRQQGVAS